MDSVPYGPENRSPLDRLRDQAQTHLDVVAGGKQARTERDGKRFKVMWSENGRLVTKTLPEVQKQIETVIMALEDAWLTEGDAGKLRVITSQLERAKAARRFFSDQATQKKMVQGHRMRRAWNYAVTNAKHFYVDSGSRKLIEKHLPRAFEDEVHLQVGKAKTGQSKVMTRLDLTRGGRAMGFSELAFLTAKRVDRFNRLLGSGKLTEAGQAHVTAQLASVRRLQKALQKINDGEKLEYDEKATVQQHTSKKMKVARFFTGGEVPLMKLELTAEGQPITLTDMRKNLRSGQLDGRIELRQAADGKRVEIRVAGKGVYRQEALNIIMEERDKLKRAIDMDHDTSPAGITKATANQARLDAIESLISQLSANSDYSPKSTGKTAAKVAAHIVTAGVFLILYHLGKWALSAETRISVSSQDAQQAKALPGLITDTFAEEQIEISEKRRGGWGRIPRVRNDLTYRISHEVSLYGKPVGAMDLRKRAQAKVEQFRSEIMKLGNEYAAKGKSIEAMKEEEQALLEAEKAAATAEDDTKVSELLIVRHRKEGERYALEAEQGAIREQMDRLKTRIQTGTQLLQSFAGDVTKKIEYETQIQVLTEKLAIAKAEQLKGIEQFEKIEVLEKDIRELQQKITDLQVREYRSFKGEVFHALAKVLNYISRTFTRNVAASESKKADLAALQAVNKHIGNETEARAFFGEALRLKEAIKKNDGSFVKMYKEIRERALASGPMSVAALEIALSHGNNALHAALQTSNVDDANFIIKQGLFTHVSRATEFRPGTMWMALKERIHPAANRSTIEKIHHMPGVSSEQREELIRNLFHLSGDGTSAARVINYLISSGNSDLAEKLLLEHLQQPPGATLIDRCYKDGVFNPQGASQLLNRLLATGTEKSLREAQQLLVQVLQSEPDAAKRLVIIRGMCRSLLADVRMQALVPHLMKYPEAFDTNNTLQALLRAQVPLEQSKHEACLLLAAKMGSPPLLEAAFDIKPVDYIVAADTPAQRHDKLEAMKQKVMPYLYMQNMHGKSLLGFAAAGGADASFVMAIDRAIREDYQNPQKLKVLKDFQALIGKAKQLNISASARREYREQVNAKFEEVIKLHPHLKDLRPYLHTSSPYKFLRSDLRDRIGREIRNRELRSPFLAKDGKGDRPLRSMNSFIAADLDKLLDYELRNDPQAQMKLTDQDPPVNCFQNGVAFYQVLKSPQYGYQLNRILLAKLAGCAIAVAATARVAHRFVDVTSEHPVGWLANQFAFQGSIMGSIGLGAAAGFFTKRSRYGRMKALEQGKTNRLEVYEETHPIGGKTRVTGAKAKVDTGPGKWSRLKKFMSRELSDTGDAMASWMAGKVGVDYTRVPLKIREANQKFVRILKHDPAKALQILRNGGTIDAAPVLPPTAQGSFGDDVIKAVYRSIPFPQQEELLSELFKIMQSPKHLEAILDAQIQGGGKGIAAAQHAIYSQLQRWRNNVEPMSVEKYEAFLLAAAKMGDLRLYTGLLELSDGAIAFTAADRWMKAGDKRTSLLHAAALSTIAGSDERSARVAKTIYEKMVSANRLLIEAEVFHQSLREDLANPFDVKRGGKRVQDVMSAKRARALDDTFGLDPEMTGSFSHLYMLREKEHLDELWAELVNTPLVKVGLNAKAGVVAEEWEEMAAEAVRLAVLAHAPGLAGPAIEVIDFAVRSTMVFLIECGVVIAGCAAGFFMGAGFAKMLKKAEDTMRGYDSTPAQLGTTQTQVEEQLIRSKQREAISKIMRDIIMEGIKGGLGELAKEAAANEDFEKVADLQELLEQVDTLMQAPIGPNTLKKLAEAFRRADLSTTDREYLQKNVLDPLSSGEFARTFADKVSARAPAILRVLQPAVVIPPAPVAVATVALEPIILDAVSAPEARALVKALLDEMQDPQKAPEAKAKLPSALVLSGYTDGDITGKILTGWSNEDQQAILVHVKRLRPKAPAGPPPGMAPAPAAAQPAPAAAAPVAAAPAPAAPRPAPVAAAPVAAAPAPAAPAAAAPMPMAVPPPLSPAMQWLTARGAKAKAIEATLTNDQRNTLNTVATLLAHIESPRDSEEWRQAYSDLPKALRASGLHQSEMRMLLFDADISDIERNSILNRLKPPTAARTPKPNTPIRHAPPPPLQAAPKPSPEPLVAPAPGPPAREAMKKPENIQFSDESEKMSTDGTREAVSTSQRSKGDFTVPLRRGADEPKRRQGVMKQGDEERWATLIHDVDAYASDLMERLDRNEVNPAQLAQARDILIDYWKHLHDPNLIGLSLMKGRGAQLLEEQQTERAPTFMESLSDRVLGPQMRMAVGSSPMEQTIIEAATRLVKADPKLKKTMPSELSKLIDARMRKDAVRDDKLAQNWTTLKQHVDKYRNFNTDMIVVAAIAKERRREIEDLLVAIRNPRYEKFLTKAEEGAAEKSVEEGILEAALDNLYEKFPEVF